MHKPVPWCHHCFVLACVVIFAHIASSQKDKTVAPKPQQAAVVTQPRPAFEVLEAFEEAEALAEEVLIPCSHETCRLKTFLLSKTLLSTEH